MEEDPFLADLSKRVSLLVMDEGEGEADVVLNPPPPPPPPPPWQSHPLQASYSLPRQQQHRQQIPGYVQEENHQQGTRETTSRGTGVFIPRFPKPTRKRGTDRHHHSTGNSSSVSSNHARLQLQQEKEGDQCTGGPSQDDSKAKHIR